MDKPPALASWWLTTADGVAHLHRQDSVPLTPATADDEFVIRIDVNDRYQTVVGFGASFTDTASWLLTEKLSENNRGQLLREYLDPIEGIGISFVRQPMGATDIARGYYSYSEGVEDDFSLYNFSLGSDREYILPVLREALKIRPCLTFLGTPWSPPAWMRVGRSMRGTDGGKLRPEAYEAYAEYFAKFIEGYAKEGIPVSWVTVQNEPVWGPNYPGLVLSAAEEGEFVAKHLGPTLERHGLGTGILIHDHTWDRVDYAQELLRDPEVARYARGTAFHRYDGTAAAGSILHDEFPDHDIFMTEGSTDVTISTSYIVENVIIGSLRHWARAIVLWNLLADEANGPYMQPGGCAICRPVTTLNTGDQTWQHHDDYYALGHVAKFVEPGAVRIGSTLNSYSTLPNVALQNPDGSIVLIVMNKGMTSHQLVARIDDQQFTACLPSGACATFVWPTQGTAQRQGTSK